MPFTYPSLIIRAIFDNVSVISSSNTSKSVVSSSPGIESLVVEDQTSNATVFSVYPNPTSGILNLNLSDYRNKVLEVVIMNMGGQSVWQRSFNSDHQVQESVNISRLSDGLYYIVVNTSNSRSTKSIMLKK